jgi:hypothetical protein
MYGACGSLDARAHTAENITKWTKEALEPVEAIGLTAERLMGAAAE